MKVVFPLNCPRAKVVRDVIVQANNQVDGDGASHTLTIAVVKRQDNVHLTHVVGIDNTPHAPNAQHAPLD